MKWRTRELFRHAWQGCTIFDEDIIRADTSAKYSEQDIDDYRRNLIYSLRRTWRLAYEYNLKAKARMKKIYDQQARIQI